MLYSTSIRFPYLFNRAQGNTELDTNFESINRSISLILLTGKGELFGNPEFGCDLKLYQYKEITPEISKVLADDMLQAILQWEHRIDMNLNDIKITKDNDTVHISISYLLRNSNAIGDVKVILPLNTPKEV
jgi:phage baseplate assembly protein W